MLETVVEKKIPPPLPPKTRRGLKTGVDGGCGGGATILQSNGHVVKIRIDPMMVDGGGGGDRAERDDGPRREVGRRSSTVKINITCVDPFVFRRHYSEVDDDDDDERSVSSGHRSPLDSGTGSDLDTGSRRDESDDGTCSCDSLTSSTADAETAVEPVTPGRSVVAIGSGAVVAPVASDDERAGPPATQTCTAAGVVATAVVATVVEELPKRSTTTPPPLPPVVHVQQRCYSDASTVTATTERVIDMDNTDQYYSFHMNENVFDEVDAAAVAAAAAAKPSDDTFAGCKTAAASDAIRSAKGTIRGVKNRVRAGIATFLQPKTNKVSPTQSDNNFSAF
ncbi:Uncharacterized protein FWK35_00011611 [Aphis craccivora]|uniref:Uncharacterized protein n=1 Tax=Aphis craccivora TaxID=307492 RepID=A0A6G0Z2Q1_APHCR|nr:Uncharacterized protein FWK35_00011611 [Aphis craccivora]